MMRYLSYPRAKGNGPKRFMPHLEDSQGVIMAVSSSSEVT